MLRTHYVIFLFLVFSLCPAGCFPSAAAAAKTTTPAADALRITINGQLVDCASPPYIDHNNRTMVPLRFIAEALGAYVLWLPTEQQAVVVHNDQTIKLKIGSTAVTIDGNVKLIDTVPVICNERTMVPLRFLGETMGVAIEWQATTKTVALQIPVQSRQGEAVVIAETVNLRSGPGTIFARIGQAVRGDVFRISGQIRQWYQVSTARHETVWIAASLVDVQPEVASRGRTVGQPAETPVPTASPPDSQGETVAETPAASPNPVESQLPYLELASLQLEDTAFSLNLVAPGASPPKIFWLEDPRRLVVDFESLQWPTGSADPVIDSNNPLIAGIRLGQFTPQTVRLVLDLKAACSYTVTAQAPDSYVLRIEPPVLKGRSVVIDPGHGSTNADGINDTGAIAPQTGLCERDLVLDVARKVADNLRAKGIKVILTRTGITSLSLEDRAEVANRALADAFVSIHANSSERPSLDGSSVYFCEPWIQPTEAQRNRRQALANSLQKQLLEQLGRTDRGVREQGFAVLRHTTIPSALVEIAYLSNPEEERLLNQPSFRNKAALAISSGIIDYLSR